jgi:hypothetical protein
LVVLDVGNPTNINRLAAYPTPVSSLVFTGTKAIVAAGDGGIQLLDLSDPTRPTLMAKVGTSASASQVVVTNELAYLADGAGGLQVLDIHDPTQIRSVGNYLGSSPGGIDVANGLAGVIESARVTILDVRDPQNISQIGSYLSFYPTAIRLVGRRAYVAGFNDLAILDLSQPGQVLTLASYPSQQLFYDMDVSGDIICAVSEPAPGGVFIFDASNPTNMALLAIHQGLDDISHRAWGYVGVRFSGDLIFASTDTYGLEVLNVANLQQPFSLGNSLLPYNFGRLYPFGSWACAPSFGGRLDVLDVRSPNHVTVEYQQDVQGGASSVFVEGDRVYVASQRRGLAVYGLDNALRLTIAKLSSNLYSLSWDALSVRLEVITDLSNPVWQTVEGSTTAHSIMRTTANASEFYRLVYTPPN